ncbi:MAG TPA: hypothetical protein VJ963_12605 [Bacteroidales bacterium]|nr:hypothetical protein [Bacteroidales bacterium]
MNTEEEYIICNRCGTKFEKDREYRSCSNCFVCSGCEIYFCPSCDNEIVLIPIKKAGSMSGTTNRDNIDNPDDTSL